MTIFISFLKLFVYSLIDIFISGVIDINIYFFNLLRLKLAVIYAFFEAY